MPPGNAKSAIIEPPIRLFFSGHEQTMPAHACGPGVWPHFLLHFVLSGSGSFISAGRSFRLAAGDAFLIIPGIVSAYTAGREDPWEYCWIGFDGRDAANSLASCGLSKECPVYHSRTPLTESKSDRPGGPVGDCMLSLGDALQHEPGNTFLHLSLLYRLFSLLSPDTGCRQASPGGYLKQAQDYMRHNYAYDIKIQDVARHVGIDRTWLYRLFMEELSMSPQQYLIDYRLNMAKQLLSSTRLRISEISNSCGFSDSAAFCRHFRARFSITPSRFRRESGMTPILEKGSRSDRTAR